MANTQTFSIKLTANGKEVKELMDALKKQADDYEKELAGINEQLKERDKLTKEEIKTLEKQADSLIAKIKGLNTAVEENITNLRKADDVLKNLAGSSGAELGKALRGIGQQFKSVSDQTLKAGETMEQKLTEIKEKMMEVRHEMAKREGVDAMKRAKATLTELANTPLDKLKMGLESIEKKLSTMSDAERQAADGMTLLQGRAQYKAQIAANEYGRAGSVPMQTMTDDQLRAEQSRLRNLYMATQGATGFEGISNDALTRLQQANKLIKDRADAEREAAKAARESELAEQRRLQFAQQGQETHKTLANMEKASYEDLENALKHLEEQRKKYIQSGDTKHIQRNLQMQDKLKQKQAELQKMMLSDQQISDRVNNSKKYNIIQLQQAYDQLKYKLSTLNTEEVKAIKETRRQMQSLEKDIKAVSGEATGLTKVWKTAVRNISTYMGVFAIAGFLKNKIQGIVKDNFALSDSMAQVQKVTGLTSKEIEQLNFSLAKLDTRTTLTQLNELAYSSGKMGLGKYGLEGVEGFVRAANQLQVALGEDLGASVDEAITPLAKLAENLGLIQKMGVEKSMMAIGSSINELSQTTTAAGRNIVDFARRIQPSAQMIGLTTDEILALGSATDSFGVSAEVSATAFTKFLAAYRTNTAEIEKILNMTPGTLDKFFNEGRAIEGLITIFQRMHEMGDLRYLEDAFKALGSEGSKMFLTFGAFSKNIDMFREHLITSNEAFAEAVSITEEFNLVQATAEGIMERANNMWQNAFVNPEGVDTIKQLAEGWYNLTKQLTESTNWLTGIKNSLEMVAWVVSNLLKMLPELTKALFFFGIAKAIRYVATEIHLMNAAMAATTTTAGKLGSFLRSNVWVLAVTSLALIGAKLYDMAKASKEAANSLSVLQEAEKDAEEESRKQRVELKKLYDATKDQTKSLEERKEALRKMVGDEKYNQYYKQLSNEKDLATAAAGAYRDLTEEIFRSAQARAYAHKIEELENKRMEKEDEKAKKEKWRDDNKGNYEAGKREYQNQQDYVNAATGGATAGFTETQIARRGAAAMKPRIIDEYEGAERAIAGLDSDIKGIDADMDKLKNKIRNLNIAPEPAGGGSNGGSNGNNNNNGDKKTLNNEYREEQQKAKALIDNIKNYYQRQMNALNELANDTNMSEGDLKTAMDRLQEHMNDALANARKAIGGEKNEWEQFKANMRQDLYEQADEEGYNFSENLLTYIMDNQLDELRQMILKLSKELNKQGNQLLDQILRKATEDEAKNIKKVTDQRKLLEQEMLEKNYTGKVDLNAMNTMEKLGIGGMTSGQIIQLQKWKSSGKSEDEEAAKQFFANREKAWYKAFANARKNIFDVINTDIEGKDGKEKLLTILFGADYQQVLKGKELEGFLTMSSDQWKVFYQKLLDYNDQWIDAQKKAYDEHKKREDYLFKNRPDVLSIDTTTQQLSQLEQQRNLFGQDATFGRQMGMVDTISNDPELMRYDLLQARAEMYYNKMYELRQQDLISEGQLKDAREQMTQAQINMQQKLMEAIQSRTQTIQNAIQPITDFAENAGQKLGDMMFNMESQSMTWNQIWKNMLLAMGKSIIQMGQQYAIQKLQRSLFNKQVEADEEMHQALLTAIAIGGAIARTTGELQIENGALVAKKVIDGQEVTEEISLATILTALGISKGAAKTIGALGWLGIPLVAVISSLLMGLLTSALSTAGAESAGSSSSTATAPKTKLVSGMLTYDKGNVDKFAGRRKLYDDGETQVYGRRRYLGEDGKVYTATAEPAPKDGLITHPIATTVQGQPALVAENGPEIVIGRETTKAIMMNEPELIRYLANYQQHGARRLFDSGNVQPVAATQPSAISHQPSDAAAERQALINRLDRSDALMEQVLYFLQNPVAPEIAMYDTGGKKGLRSKMKEADRFMARYGG